MSLTPAPADQQYLTVLTVLSRHGIRLPADTMRRLTADLVEALWATSRSAPWKPAKGYAERKPVARKNPAPGWRVCATCEATKPIEQFGSWTETATGRRNIKTSCRPCLNDKQQNRYISAKQLAALNALRLELVADDEMAGLRCLDCDQVIVAGDEIVAESGLRHLFCSQQHEAGAA